MLYNVINQKNGETCQIEARHVSGAMAKARRLKGWANYGNVLKDGVLTYRNYVISKGAVIDSTTIREPEGA